MKGHIRYSKFISIKSGECETLLEAERDLYHTATDIENLLQDTLPVSLVEAQFTRLHNNKWIGLGLLVKLP